MMKSRLLHLERVGIQSAKEVQSIFDAAPTFMCNVEGVERDPGYAARDLRAIPPGCVLEQKYYFIIRSGETGIGLADIIRDYPDKRTALLGLLLLSESWQGDGAGRAAYGLLEKFAKTVLEAKKLRLAYNDTNPVSPFWEKMGFKRTGETKPYHGIARQSVVSVMEKRI